MSISASNRRCRADNKRGERCSARAVERGLCAAHAGLVDMKAIGKKGGSRSPLTALRKAAAGQDDELRELARDTLSKALRGEQVDKQQLDAARSLFSYRAAEAPREPGADGAYVGPLTADGRRPTSLADVVAFARQLDHVPPDLLAACRVVVAAAEGAPPKKFSRNPASSQLPGTHLPQRLDPAR